jgi:hypothetical protein
MQHQDRFGGQEEDHVERRERDFFGKANAINFPSIGVREDGVGWSGRQMEGEKFAGWEKGGFLGMQRGDCG